MWSLYRGGLCAEVVFKRWSLIKGFTLIYICIYFRFPFPFSISSFHFHCFQLPWLSTSHIIRTEWTVSPSMELFTDTLGSHGWGAYWAGRWIHKHWPAEHSHKNITWKELYAITAGVNTWGHLWECKKVLFHCDNEAVCAIWHKGQPSAAEVMALVCMLYFFLCCLS